ncbi:MAG: DUF1294 domain-containing protein [Bacilli bacterium]|nr:DUF1294 domain-containing protein [Bacilli bacterium]
MKIVNIYLIIINILSLVLMILDKILAIKKKQRISEFHLLTITIFGGSIGTIIGMILAKHKIRKLKFILLVPLSLILHIFIYIKL